MSAKKAKVISMPADARRKASAAFEELLAVELDGADVQMHLASGADDNGVPSYQRVEMHADLAADFAIMARGWAETLRGRNRPLAGTAERSDGPIEVRVYDAGAHLLPYQVEAFDLDLEDHQFVTRQLRPLLAKSLKQDFDADPVFVAGLRFHAVSLHSKGQPIHFYRSYTRKLQLDQSRFQAMIMGRGRFNRVDSCKVFLFDRQVDCFSRGRWMFILSKDKFHQNFRYFEHIKREAGKTLQKVSKLIPIHNLPDFKDDVRANVAKIAKVRSISQRPYLERREVAMDDIRRVIGEFGLEIEIKKVRGREKLVYDRAQPWELLRLLDDDYLVSDMTQRGYEVTGKRPHKIRRPKPASRRKPARRRKAS